MPRQHKPHRARNAWKKDILRLACLLRLRCAPPVPYSAIADLLIRTKPSVIGHLIRHHGPEELVIPAQSAELKAGSREWLIGHLEEIYANAVRDASVHWERVRDLSEEEVRSKTAELGLFWDECLVVSDEGFQDTVPEADEDEYPREREIFFEDMVSGIVDEPTQLAMRPRKRRKLNPAARNPRQEVMGGEDDEWRPPDFDQRDAFKRGLHEQYQELLAQLRVVDEFINACTMEISALEQDVSLEVLQEPIPLLPDIGQSCSDQDSESVYLNSEATPTVPQLITESEQSEWQNYISGETGSHGPSLMEEAAKKAFAEWQNIGGTQGWLEMTR